jgi:hypothetical protein
LLSFLSSSLTFSSILLSLLFTCIHASVLVICSHSFPLIHLQPCICSCVFSVRPMFSPFHKKTSYSEHDWSLLSFFELHLATSYLYSSQSTVSCSPVEILKCSFQNLQVSIQCEDLITQLLRFLFSMYGLHQNH